jgi:hypothetical protein
MSDGETAASASAPASAGAVVTYFKGRGRAEDIRLSLAGISEPFENDYVDGDWMERRSKGLEVRTWW